MEKILSSGAKLMITRSDLEVCDRLLMAVTGELKQVNMDLGLGLGDLLNFSEVSINKDGALNTLKNAVFQIVSSASIRPILWECMERVVYNGQKVTRATFEDDKAIGDYLTVAKEVLVANLLPFFPGASSKLSILGKVIT